MALLSYPNILEKNLWKDHLPSEAIIFITDIIIAAIIVIIIDFPSSIIESQYS
jgi:hypothetical protein